MSEKVLSLDIQSGIGTVLDIARFFPMTPVRTIEFARQSDSMDDIVSLHERSGQIIDISLKKEIRIARFRTLETLDIAAPEVIALMEKYRSSYTPKRPQRLDIVPPLTPPYGALDIRRDRYYPRSITYPDLFARKLPYPLMLRRVQKSLLMSYRKYQRRIWYTVALSLLVSVPMVSYAAYALNHGYTTLQQIGVVRDTSSLKTMIRSARGDFERANFLLTPFSWIPVDQMQSVRRIILGGLSLTRGLDLIAQEIPTGGSGGLLVQKDQADPLSYRAPAKDIFPLETLGINNPTDWINQHIGTLNQVREELRKAGEYYTQIVPTGERTTRIQKIGLLLNRGVDILDFALQNHQSLLTMLGDTNPERYIVFNQNRDEIRANGGFPGSIISFTLYKGNILDFHSDDVYYYDWNLYPYKEIPPPGIALLTGNYGLRDVNYYPDFRYTLEKANSFIERSGDASVTTAFAIHQGIVEDILDRVGPVTLSGVSVPFDSHNFSLLMSTLVENKYAKENTPKDILFRFMGAFAAKIQEKNAYLDVIDTIESSLKDGEILFASRDTEIDGFLAKYKKPLPWEQSDAQNWIYPVWTSVSGNKSDRYIHRYYTAQVTNLAGCMYENTVTLETRHQYGQSDTDTLKGYFEKFGITDREEQEKLSFIQGNGKNRAYVRVFAPSGAMLSGTGKGMESSQESGTTVFSTLMETPVGGSTSKTFRYTLNIPNCEHYDNKIQWIRQPGLREVKVK